MGIANKRVNTSSLSETWENLKSSSSLVVIVRPAPSRVECFLTPIYESIDLRQTCHCIVAELTMVLIGKFKRVRSFEGVEGM